MYEFIKGVLFYSGTIPGVGLNTTPTPTPSPTNTPTPTVTPTVPGPSFLLDTTGFTDLWNWTDSSSSLDYNTFVATAEGIALWKVDSLIPTVRSFVHFYEWISDFTTGTIIDLTSLLSGSPNNTQFFFSLLGGGYSGMYEIPTNMTVLSATGAVSSLSVVNVSASTVSPYDVPQFALIDSGTHAVIQVLNNFIGVTIPSPSANQALFKLIRLVPDIPTDSGPPAG